jgi:predicted nicotinamide N-methyase
MDSPLSLWDVSSPRKVAFARMRALGTPVAIPLSAFSLNSDENNADAYEEESFGGDGLAAPLTALLSFTYDEWLRSTRMRCKLVQMAEGVHDEEKKDEDVQKNADSCKPSTATTTTTKFIVHETRATISLRQVLQLHAKLSHLDSTIAEELGREGSHAVLSKLIRFDLQSELERAGILSFDMPEEEVDAVMELQDLACEIGSLSGGSFPVKVAPFTTDELRSRLPLHFSVSSVSSHDELDFQQAHHILIHQVTARRQGAQEDVGFVMWPSAVALASWVASNPSKLLGKKCLEIGAGCGLTGLATASIFAAAADSAHEASQIILTDFNETVLQNADRNICLNDLEGYASTNLLDFYNQKGTKVGGSWIDGKGNTQEPVDVVLAADVICKPEDAMAAANTIYDALRPGGNAYIISADAKHRFGVDRFSDECLRVGLEVTVSNVSEMYDGSLVSSSQGEDGKRGIEQCSGYVDGMTLSFFHVSKPQI